MREHIYLIISNANASILRLILPSSLADSNAILSTSSTSQVYFATVVWRRLKCLLGYHGLQWPQVMSPLRQELTPKCCCLPVSLEKENLVGKSVMTIHIKKKFPLSEIVQEFQIQLGGIRKKLKSNLKSSPTFLLLFLQSDYCCRSVYWQMFQKWAVICLKNTFLVMMELFFLKNGFAATLWKEPRCSYFSMTSAGLKLHPEILLGRRAFGVVSTSWSCRVKFSDTARQPARLDQRVLCCLSPLFSACVDGTTSLPGVVNKEERTNVWP